MVRSFQYCSHDQLTIVVSEDFDMSLRLQMSKFIVRLATYHNGGFKEGVSLTVYDELARWEKYNPRAHQTILHAKST